VTALQSVLDAAGPEAARIEALWWLMLWVTTAVTVIVFGFIVAAVIRGRRGVDGDSRPVTGIRAPLHAVDAGRGEKTLERSIGIAVGLTVVTLFVLLFASVATGRAVGSLGEASAVTINIIGHQWWWEVEYEEAVSNRRVKTANEIHIPVGRPVVFKVTSRDVIHSFWVPNLQGKRDLIPGYVTAIWLQADRPGLFRGQCAEFCGHQHARMAMYVTAESNDDFERWLANQRKPAVDPSAGAPASNDAAAKGRDVFLRAPCTQCHTIRGTIAGATVGPDLTHLATRGTIGAGTLQNTPEQLARWILNSQHIKPGNRMPPMQIAEADLQPLVTYLESLK
jgi:cytochrome c oxidase subunit 2